MGSTASKFNSASDDLEPSKKALVGKMLGVGKCQVEHNGDEKCNNWSLGRICKIASRADKYDTRESNRVPAYLYSQTNL